MSFGKFTQYNRNGDGKQVLICLQDIESIEELGYQRNGIRLRGGQTYEITTTFEKLVLTLNKLGL